MRRRFYILFFLAALLPAACGGGPTPVFVTAAITAGSGLTAFEYDQATAYWANFGAAGLGLSGAESSGAVMSYKWEQISGPAATFTSGTSSQTINFDAPPMTAILSASDQYRWQPLPISIKDIELKFRLTVADAEGHSDVAFFAVHLFDDGYQVRPATGLTNIGVGEKAYLSGPSLKANENTPSVPVIDWSWTLTPPAGSAATLSNANSQIANFRPDVAGTYAVGYASVSAGVAGTFNLTASDYVGVGTIADETSDRGAGQCGACHNGTVEPDTLTQWQATGHASIFRQAIGLYRDFAPQPFCWECHTVGYDTDPQATNGGFDDLVRETGYNFPSSGTTWDQFVIDNPTLTELTNVQCEDCHGPGSVHTGTFSTWDAGICGRCHKQEAEWKISAHDATGVENGAGRYQLTLWHSASCARCHSSGGFAQEAAGETVTAQDPHDFLVTCQACHDPHSTAADTPQGETSESGNDSTQLRLKGMITMKDDARTQVDAGYAAVCYACHDGFYSYDEPDCDSNGDGTADAPCTSIDQAATQYFRMPHQNVQSFVLEGVGAVTTFSDSAYDFTLSENSFHSSTLFTPRNGSGNQSLSDENNKCLTCHMDRVLSSWETVSHQVGGHTFKMSDGASDNVAACNPCHPALTDFNRQARADYDGDGSVEGVMDEIKGLLLALTTKILSIDSTHISGGTVKNAEGKIVVNALGYGNQARMNAVNIDVRRAVYDYNLIAVDGSLGVHNTAFAVDLLQKTYSAISQLSGGKSFAEDYPSAVLR